MKTAVLVLTTLMLGCMAGAAQATSTATAPKGEAQEVVSYADLDLASPTDAEILLQRVQAAARRVCIRSGLLLALDTHNPVRRCADAATERAMAEVNARSGLVAAVRP